MHTIIGNIWEEVGRADIIFVTSNSTLTSDGRLVMGAGIAKEAKSRYPDIDEYYGDIVGLIEGDYGILLSYPRNIGLFQTKRNWKDESDLDLIKFSLRELNDISPFYERIALNCPGIGLGKLKYSQLRESLELLPENIFIYFLHEDQLKN